MRDGSFAKRKLFLLLSAGALVFTVLFLEIAAFLEREVVYTYEEVAAGLVIHETGDGCWVEAALYPETGFAVSNETISVDEESNVRYVSLYVYLSTKAKNRYFEEVSPTPFLAIWDHRNLIHHTQAYGPPSPKGKARLACGERKNGSVRFL